MKAVRRLLIALVAAGALFALITLAALEGPEVVVLRTTGADGTTRETRTWIADHAGTAWIEAASPEREFYRQILKHPDIELRRHGALQRYRAVPLATREGHELIRKLLSEKYGLADRWIGLLADTSGSIAIRLEPQ